MKLSVFQWSPLRGRLLAIVIATAVISSTAWCAIGRVQPHRSTQRSIRILEALRLTDASDSPIDLTGSRSNVCEVHGVEMYVGTVPVIYGLLERPLRNTLAERAAPHAYSTAAGGCIVRSSSQDARTYICPECVRQATDMTYSYSQPQPMLPRLDFPHLK